MAVELDQWYLTRNGNPHGVPVVHIGVNLQTPWEAGLGSEQGTDYFIDFYGLEIVGNDYKNPAKHDVRRHFFKVDQQPLFSIINGVADSPTHAHWELLVNESNGILTSGFPWRDIIDQVRPAASDFTLGRATYGVEGSLSFVISGSAGTVCEIEVTRDLADWELIGTLTNLTGTVEFTDPDAGRAARGFYRAVRR